MTRKYHEKISELLESLYEAEGYAGRSLRTDIADILENAYAVDQEQLTTIEQIPSCGADEPRTR